MIVLKKAGGLEMALMFHRRLAIPVWAIVFLTVVFAAPRPATLLLMPTLFIIALAGIAVLVSAMPGAFPGLRPSRSLARVRPSIRRVKTSARSAMDGEI
jgi:hypothetical protein